MYILDMCQLYGGWTDIKYICNFSPFFSLRVDCKVVLCILNNILSY